MPDADANNDDIEATMEGSDGTHGSPVDAIHPAPAGFTDAQLLADPILRYFHFAHLPPSLQVTSIKFYELACYIIDTLPRNAERSVALRKLLEAKDAAVRANVT
ncbi:hypothetical protein [Sphingopyxis sp. H050]|jgi:hypothetical protein|uniref:hypothetical protein n=1 Tax=Sphingopyxis sp. H050 TaxID=1759072 RepID=UPI000AA9E559|nr:hypothetical protein [Sphingopyxis sp. H050]